MADLQETLGKVIRRERQQRRLTMRELGERAGLSEIYVGEIERGQKYPSARVLESVAAALELEVAELLELVAAELRGASEAARGGNAGLAFGFGMPTPAHNAVGAQEKRAGSSEPLAAHQVLTMAGFSSLLLAGRLGEAAMRRSRSHR
ncbi:MAG: helix-turn-helix transcriptional regulator [Thermogemmatispora sp.]|uniref:helix-turn-helix domain-containing protein n=1 Tax=Thermogemmatispora sp. TaxID=1968838 RepID=UPI0026142FFF|nr:helix-turn-helix transcriptional regulator [Thermogemmatispora sp.]MBX5459353.1 helix-turn-helix transcriptional regulator [Thermogemmatispora sp.]